MEYWLNMNAGLLFVTKDKSILGKSVKYDTIELDHIVIDGEFYRLGESKGTLVHLYPCQKEDLVACAKA